MTNYTFSENIRGIIICCNDWWLNFAWGDSILVILHLIVDISESRRV